MHVKTALLKKLAGRLNINVQSLGKTEHACSDQAHNLRLFVSLGIAEPEMQQREVESR